MVVAGNEVLATATTITTNALIPIAAALPATDTPAVHAGDTTTTVAASSAVTTEHHGESRSMSKAKEETGN